MDDRRTTYRIFDGRRWHGPFRREELPAQGLRPDSLVKAAGEGVPSRAELLPELQSLLAASVPLATPAGGASLAYRGARPGSHLSQTSRGWAVGSIGLAGATWAAVLPLAEGVPQLLRHLVQQLGEVSWIAAVVVAGLVAVACGTVGLTRPSMATVARVGRICAWMTPNFLWAISCFFTWRENIESSFRAKWPETLVFGFGIYPAIVMAIDSVLDRLTTELRSRFRRR